MNKLPIILFFITLLLSGCGSNESIKKGNVSSTDLQLVSIENLKIGDSIKDADLTKYSRSDFGAGKNQYNFEDSSYKQNPNTYNFEKLRLITDNDGIILKIVRDILGYVTVGDYSTVGGIAYSINGEALFFYTIDEIIDVLGSNYNEYWYDKGQLLKAYTYTDKDKNISLTFVCDDNSDNFVWVILSE